VFYFALLNFSLVLLYIFLFFQDNNNIKDKNIIKRINIIKINNIFKDTEHCQEPNRWMERNGMPVVMNETGTVGG